MPEVKPEDRIVIQAELLAMGAERQAAVNELAEVGVTTPSPADVEAWIKATPRDRRRMTMAYALYQGMPEPEWKARRH
jgi:hypothetical protein